MNPLHDAHVHAFGHWLAERLVYLKAPEPLKHLVIQVLSWNDLRILADGIEAEREFHDLMRRVSGPLSAYGMGRAGE